MMENVKAMDDKQVTQQRDPLPENFETIEEFDDFWSSHSSADYEDLMDDVVVEIDLSSSKTYYPVAKELSEKLRVYARQQGVSTETLLNLWVQEKLTKVP
jgi:hypothetical protein